jgi:fatty acid synthase
MAPKAVAIDYLDKISRQHCPLLKHFVVFSSMSCGRGNAGQSNYGMANSVMERIIEQRHKAKLPAKAIQWGAIGEVGIVGEMLDDNMDMEIGGTLPQRISSCLEELDTLMTVNSPIVSSMVVAAKRFIGSSKGDIVEMIMNIMSIRDIKTLSMETKLSELGMDSLMTVEISQALEREFNLVLTPTELRSMTLSQLKTFQKKSSKDSEKMNGIAYLLRYWGEESRSHETIIKLESMMNEGNTKALIVPGVEGKLKFFLALQSQRCKRTAF